MMEVRKQGLVLALVLSCFFVQAFCQPFCKTLNPRVGCPAGHDTPNQIGYTAPSAWGSLCPYYQQCSAGKQQSPLNLALGNLPVGLGGRANAKLNLTLGTEQVRLTRGRDWLVLPVTGSHTLRWMEYNWSLQRLEFHSPSEHTLNGRNFPLEVQLYFQWTDRRGTFTAAVSVLYKVGGTCDDAFLSSLTPAIPCQYKCSCGNNRTENFGSFVVDSIGTPNTILEECDQGPDNAFLPNRCRPNCKLPFCGDGIVDSLYEQCDSGANNSRTGGSCRPNCKLPYCGDGIVDPGETCDDSNKFEGDGCSANCTLECGDCCLQAGEQCDPCLDKLSNQTGAVYSVCRTNCFFARCGDGIVDQGEQCDTGNFRNATSLGGSFAPNDCRPNCTLPVCGDGVTDTQYGETCDPPNTPLCSANCTLRCGNGVVDTQFGIERCDNGTALNSNASNALCRLNCQPRTCGDGIVDPLFGEQCDSFGVETYFCYANCTFKCGNRLIQGTEGCDNGDPSIRPFDGNSDSRPNACRLNCQPFFCGDGITDPLGCEQCDNGRNNSFAPNSCRPNCKFPVCGDNVTDAGEQCDDGNNVDDDGCSCCRLDCGNGIKQGSENCDDGPANSATLADRCRPNCRRHYCGDGVVDSDEECDTNIRGCINCRLPFCGDGILQSWLGEECDFGVNNSYAALDSGNRLGCSPLCTINRCGQTFPAPSTNVNLWSVLGGRDSLLNTIYYQGSETRPPCTENVQWFVSTTVRTLSARQYSAFAKVLRNSRPAQGTYGRWPLYYPTVGSGLTPNFARDSGVCGDGFLASKGEACDDGNVLSGDGCSPTCTIEPKWSCLATPTYISLCFKCGDGVRDPTEQCDTGRHNNDAVPDSCRTNCKAPSCGDGVVDGGEECDGGAYCTSTCKLDKRSYIWRPTDRKSNTCGSGNLQSPIRLPAACPSGRLLNLNHPSNVQYNPAPIVLFNTADKLLFPISSGGSFSYQGVTYSLKWIEFHEPSEHYIGNQQFAFEVQLFHQAQNPGVNEWAVLAVLFQAGQTPNAFLQPLLDRLPPVSDCLCGNGIKEDVMVLPDGRVTREECDAGALNNDHIPNRCRTNCRMAYCGDKVVDSCEACDQGPANANLPNKCRPTCVLPFCGDGITDDLLGETCDDGNNKNNDGCNSQCQLECGDGVIQGAEQCDDGHWNSNTKSDACRTTCRTASCGDGAVDFSLNEQCDDGAANGFGPSACRPSCVLPFCGDGIVDHGEQCDSTANCSTSCTLLCGNGVVDTSAGEQCDAGSCNSNNVPNACRTNCQNPTCGDGVRDNGEECDTAGNTPACFNCQIRCGNGIIDDGEECDDGILNSNTVPNACRTNCKLYFCGDGVADWYEECDTGAANANASDTCRTWCRIPTCGDGIVDKSSETCDDGNLLDGDGCSCVCQKECGNGRVDPGEVCDAGAGNSDTRPACCRTSCTLPKCGDGITDPGEECDNGANMVFGPNNCRADCTLPRCGDGIVDNLFGETCDLGSRNSLTAVDGCSPTCNLNLCRQSVWLNTTVNPAEVLPTAPGVYHYRGSRNSDPCTENFNWFVFSTPVPISNCQLGQFRAVQPGNNRCLQPRNNRPVNLLELTAKCGDGIVEGNEQCDNGPANSDFAPNACRRHCLLPKCGDGVQDKGEQCDGTPNCTPQCTLTCAAGAAAANATAATAANTINVNFADILATQ